MAFVANKDLDTVTLQVRKRVIVQPGQRMDIMCTPSREPSAAVSWGVISPHRKHAVTEGLPTQLLVPHAVVRYERGSPVIVSLTKLTTVPLTLYANQRVAYLQEGSHQLMKLKDTPAADAEQTRAEQSAAEQTADDTSYTQSASRAYKVPVNPWESSEHHADQDTTEHAADDVSRAAQPMTSAEQSSRVTPPMTLTPRTETCSYVMQALL